jgi:UDP-N-acetyl-D-mannosaminuronate dehydrogenase
LKERFKNKNAKIGIEGQGYEGLPLAVKFVQGSFASPDSKWISAT